MYVASDVVRNAVFEVAAENLRSAADAESDADAEGLFIFGVPLRGENDPSRYDRRLGRTKEEATCKKAGVGLACCKRSKDSAPNGDINGDVLC